MVAGGVGSAVDGVATAVGWVDKDGAVAAGGLNVPDGTITTCVRPIDGGASADCAADIEEALAPEPDVVPEREVMAATGIVAGPGATVSGVVDIGEAAADVVVVGAMADVEGATGLVPARSTAG